MIGHYLLTLTPEQEADVLVSPMCPGRVVRYDNARCLVGVTEDWYLRSIRISDVGYRRLSACSTESRMKVAKHYDRLCYRFGTDRINIAIRNRILANQARRVLAELAVGAAS